MLRLEGGRGQLDWGVGGGLNWVPEVIGCIIIILYVHDGGVCMDIHLSM